MKEEFLHYLWRYKKFDTSNLQTSSGEFLQIINSGQYLQLAGPDFFNAQILIGNQKWAGNIEIHLKSSDWYSHQHETDPAYANVILHVVWEHDTEIFRKDNSEIPVLQLQQYVSLETIESYRDLCIPKTWIYCERQLLFVEQFVLNNWREHLFFERLEQKTIPVQQMLEHNGNDWEATLFCQLAKNFGLNTNGPTFQKIAESIPFNVIRKENHDALNIEALLFGRSGLLDDEKEDIYFRDLKKRWLFLSQKYRLPTVHIDPVQFFKHRPDNFPTIRLSQLAQLYHAQHNLFSKLLVIKSAAQFYDLCKVDVSDYWKSHYQFDRESPMKRKTLSIGFMDLLLINSVVPIQFAYARSQGLEISEQLIFLLECLPSERNAIIDKFASFGITSENAFQSQALLQLKNEYCNNGRCLHCGIGTELLKSTSTQKSL